MLRQEDIQEFLKKMSAPDEVKKVEFPSFDAHVPAKNLKVGLNYLNEVQVLITAELGQATMKIKDIIKLTEGSVIELDQAAGENARILINDQKMGTGGLVIIGNNFGVRIESIYNIKGKETLEVSNSGQRNTDSSN
ncbi:MAG: flagellar motor switch protein FliN [Peptococcaceae bacterium]|nr:flagellar motor switch protein FliN [Peptococcaceae bacterium]